MNRPLFGVDVPANQLFTIIPHIKGQEKHRHTSESNHDSPDFSLQRFACDYFLLIHNSVSKESLLRFLPQSNTTNCMSISSLIQLSVSSRPYCQASLRRSMLAEMSIFFICVFIYCNSQYSRVQHLHPTSDSPRSLNATWLTCGFYEGIFPMP